MIKPELLVPAGDLERLKVAILYGADAVFIGGMEYGLRANANNFSIADIKKACDFAKEYGKKIYVTTNIFFHDENLDGFIDYIKQLDECGVAALITADICAIKMIIEHTSMEVHLSTQQSVMNKYSAMYFKNLGVSRIVLARECSSDDVKAIMDYTNIEIEVFIHGSMCIGYSGRCMLSNHMTARDSNRGGCSQNCRWEYEVESISEEIKFSMNPDDLSLVHSIEKMCEMGIASLKIEGRMRSIYYIANVVYTYHKLIDAICSGIKVNVNEMYENLLKSANRNISGQYFDGMPTHNQQLYNSRNETPSKDFCLLVLESNNEFIKIEQRNYFKVGDVIEVISPNGSYHEITIDKLFDKNLEEIMIARHPQEILYINSNITLEPYSMGRLKR